MTTDQLPTQIRAEIHPDAITRVSAFFNASNDAVLNELLQNCRRAGATAVEITSHDDGSLTVSDNGRGIDDPATLLSFGMSGWTHHSATREHPAGMGLYALARCERVTIRSKPEGGPAWEVELQPGHFTGEEAATVTPLDRETAPAGTSVTFHNGKPQKDPYHDRNPANTVPAACRYYPLPVTLNGDPVAQEDFLAKAFYTQEWRGIRIGILHGPVRSRLNFHGIVIGDPKLPAAGTLQSNLYAQADVRDAADLELTLPARKELVENQFAAELRTACLHASYRAIATSKDPMDVSKETQNQAREAGMEIPDARPLLLPWEAQIANWAGRQHRNRTELEGRTLVMDAKDMEPPDEQTLGRALDRAGLSEAMRQADDRLVGYRWYDALTKVTSVRVMVKNGDEELDLEETRKSGGEGLDQRPDAITVTMMTEGPEGQEELVFPADVWFMDPDERSWSDVAPMVTKASDIQAWDLTELMEAAYFNPIDDNGADSHDTQKDYAEQTFERIAVALLLTEEDAMKAALAGAAMRHLFHEIPNDKAAVITIQRGSAPDVRIIPRTEQPAPSG